MKLIKCLIVLTFICQSAACGQKGALIQPNQNKAPQSQNITETNKESSQ